MCCSLWGRKESDTTELLNWTEAIQKGSLECAQMEPTPMSSITWSGRGGKTNQPFLGLQLWLFSKKTDQQKKNKPKFINMSIHVYLADPQENE